MLKKVYFEGMMLVDLEKDPFDYNYYLQQALSDCGIEVDYTVRRITKATDIPEEWRKSFPYGDRKDNKVCIDIFFDELNAGCKTEMLNDPNQTKFSFWDEAKRKS